MIKIGFTYPCEMPDEVDRVVELLDTEIDWLHVRKPYSLESEVRSFIEQMPAEYHNRLVLHAEYELMDEFDLKGISLKKDYSEENLRFPIQSYSAHSFEEIETLNVDPEYVFLSPIWNSISKPEHLSAFSEDDLKAFLAKTDRKIIALGGVDESKIERAEELGFSGYGMLGSIWNTVEVNG